MSADAARKRIRLTREQRREQLLDVTAELIVAQGLGAMTMERLASWAGVSKALPYSHFDDAEGALIALYEREVTLLAVRVADALAAAPADSDAVEVLVTTYFSAVEDRGDVLAVVATPGSPVARLAPFDPQVAQAFVADVLVDHVGVPRESALLVTGLVVSGLTGAVQTWADGLASRTNVERATIAFIRAGLAELS